MQSNYCNVKYKFQCTYQLVYHGRTSHQFGFRAKEHVPTQVRQSTSNRKNTTGEARDDDGESDRETDRNNRSKRLSSSLIVQHLMITCLRADLAHSFTIVHRARNRQPLQFSEAVAIKRMKPAKCDQKELFVSLFMPF